MVKIYTKKGDDGTTSLWYGGRVPKHHGRTEAYGALDEACSELGVARALCEPEDGQLAADILSLQNDIFIAGAELATAPEAADRLEDGVSRTPRRWCPRWRSESTTTWTRWSCRPNSSFPEAANSPRSWTWPGRPSAVPSATSPPSTRRIS